MFSLAKRIARRVLPEWIAARFRPATWQWTVGPYKTWAEAEKQAVGYDAPAILDVVRTAALAVKQGRAAFEQDGMTFERPQYRSATLACLLHVALQTRGLHVVDFGGSLGSVYFQHRRFFEGTDLRWSVVEQPHYVTCGNAEFANEQLGFYNSIEEAQATSPVDVVLFGGSLQYIEKPQDLLTHFADLKIPYLILDRIWQIDALDDLIMVQHVGPPMYTASFPVHHKLSRSKLWGHLNSIGYEIITALPEGCFVGQKRQ